MLHTDLLLSRDIQKEACREKVTLDLAVVTISVSSPHMMVAKQDVRVTLVDKIGMLGKNTN